MSKELFVSSTPHETKVAIVEDDQLAEIYFERENEYTLAGSIYKGKVTRVLPGMQSAFVDLGLERDAFLYVTDFLEEQEDQEEFDQVVTQAHERAAKGGAPALDVPLRPIEAEEVLAAEPGNQVERPPRHDGERQPLSNAATIQEAGGDIVRPEVDGNRDDRGRGREGGREGGRWRGRRRRGRRGRGGQDRQGAGRGPEPQGASPENIQESPRGEEPPREAEQPEFRRAVPGEERYERPDFGEPSSERPREEQRTESMDRGAERGPRFDRGDRGGRDRGGRGGRDRGGRDRGGRDRDRGGREAGGREAGGRPANYQPIILPGESISKYRNIQPLPGETLSRPAGTEAQEPRPSAEVLGGESIARYRQEEAQPHRGFAEQPAAVAAQPSADDTQVQTTFTPPLGTNEREQRHERDDERRFEQMNVASVFGGDEATQAPEPSVEDEFPRGRQHEPQAAPPAFGGGVVEEEEIEEEESDALELGEDLDGDFEELEEEELEAEDGEQLINAGAELTDAVREAHVQDRATGHYESNGIENGDSADDEGDDEGTEFEELEGEEGDEEPAEIRADREGEPDDAGDFEESEESSPDRAELRGPSGTAGLQRPERAEREQRRDRFDRGRGGRRGRRGRGRNVRGGGGRRNIQSAGRPAINELLKEGQEILVQIAKEPMGKKGARITSHIALPGRFLVYMPTVAHIGVSRKIGSDEERQRLKRILLSERDETKAHGGFIVRTAAAGASEDDLRADIRFLVNLWNEIKQRAESGKAPALIYHDLNLVERVLRDQVTQNFTHIWVDNEAEYERVLRFIGRFQPSLVKRVKLYTKDTPLFESFGIQEEINKALKSKVWLKSGGYIVINQTEALVAIDVNTGKYVGKTGRLEDTIVKTNVDAIKEIVRQIRLRDLGGIIVIDFIDMDERRNRQKVMQALEEALRSDRAPSKVLQFNDFGLVAITRKRVKQSLERTLGQPCTYCTGTGLIKSVTTVCNEIYVEMRKMAKAIDKSDVILRVNPEVGKQLKANGARQLSEMEEMTGRTIIVRTDPTLHQEQFDIQ